MGDLGAGNNGSKDGAPHFEERQTAFLLKKQITETLVERVTIRKTAKIGLEFA